MSLVSPREFPTLHSSCLSFIKAWQQPASLSSGVCQGGGLTGVYIFDDPRASKPLDLKSCPVTFVRFSSFFFLSFLLCFSLFLSLDTSFTSSFTSACFGSVRHRKAFYKIWYRKNYILHTKEIFPPHITSTLLMFKAV